MKKLVAFLFIVSTMSGISFGQEKSNPIKGTWKLVEHSFSSPDTSWTNAPSQPGLFMFAEEYYSMMYISGKKPRPLMENYTSRYKLDDKQIRSCFLPFVANAGKYELDGNKLKTFAKVALIPNFMAGDGWVVEVKIDGKNMHWHRVSENVTSIYKFIRLE